MLIDIIILSCMYLILYPRILLLESMDVRTLDGHHVLRTTQNTLSVYYQKTIFAMSMIFSLQKKSFSLKEGIAFDEPHF